MCGAGRKRCGGNCVAIDNPDFGCGPQTCDQCNTTACSDGGTCATVACKPGFVDCNDMAADGCEVRFGPEPSDLTVVATDGGAPDASSGNVYGIPRTPRAISIDGQPDDWDNRIQLVPLEVTCNNCQQGQNQVGGRNGYNIRDAAGRPSPTDLAAYARVAWDAGALYVITLTKDDDFVPIAPKPSGLEASDAELQDGLELLLDSDFNPLNTTDNDYHLFIGFSTGASDHLKPMTPVGEPGLEVARSSSGRCHFIEARLSASFLSPTSTPLAENRRLGFSVAVNDWDTHQGVPDRDHQVFWKDPGPEYAVKQVGYPAVQLVATP